eukprot:COSAG02_NODE_466_length_21773_cov_71.190966_7_plen_176_part_00
MLLVVSLLSVLVGWFISFVPLWLVTSCACSAAFSLQSLWLGDERLQTLNVSSEQHENRRDEHSTHLLACMCALMLPLLGSAVPWTRLVLSVGISGFALLVLLRGRRRAVGPMAHVPSMTCPTNVSAAARPDTISRAKETTSAVVARARFEAQQWWDCLPAPSVRNIADDEAKHNS